jgi:effector-binding domain-containing protein
MQIAKKTLVGWLTKAGLDPESDAFKAFAGKDAPEDSDVKLPDAALTALDGKLLGLEAAKIHPEVTAAAQAKYYGLVDEATNTFLKTAGLDDAAIKTLFDGKKTPVRVAEALAHVQKLAKESGKGSNEERENAWKTEKQKFEDQIKTLTSDYESEKTGREADRNQYALSSFLGDREAFKLRDDLPNLGEYAQMALLKKIGELPGAKLIAKDGKPMLVMKDDPEKPYHKTGDTNPLDLKAWTAEVLAEGKFLNLQPGGQNQQHGNPMPPNQQNQPPANTQAAASLAVNDQFITAPTAPVVQ